MSKTAKLEEGSSVRGGVPICWPQFAKRGPLPLQHGFTRQTRWRLLSQSKDSASLALSPGDVKKDLFRLGEGPERCYEEGWELVTIVQVCDNCLDQRLVVHNTGNDDLEFSGALHTYFQVSDLANVQVTGLKNSSYEDTSKAGRALGEERFRKDESDGVVFQGETDRVYAQVGESLQLQDGHRTVHIQKEGFPDVVVWNPDADKAGGMADLSSWRDFVCVEPAVAAKPVCLQPGKRWEGRQTLQSSVDPRL